jgi:TetR/AcrR family transcriptional repressor of nem operon
MTLATAPATDSPTKLKLLEAAQSLMLRKGFTATTVDEICAGAKLTKGSFFHYFTTKEDLGQQVLAHYWSSTQARVQTAPHVEIQDPLARLHGYLDLFVALARQPEIEKSCLFGNFAQEIATTHSALRETCAEGFTRWRDQIAAELEEAKKVHTPSVDFDSASLADHFIVIYEGSLILAKARQDPRVIERGVEHFRRYLDVLFGENRKRKEKRAS